MGTSLTGKADVVILYAGMRPDWDVDRKRLAGIERFAKPRGIRVETIPPAGCTREAVRDAIARFRPVGCVAECHDVRCRPRQSWFGRVPTVFLNPPERREWRDVARVVCDEAAVARMAFDELSAGNPPCYEVAIFTSTDRQPWAIERIRAFRECCAAIGAECRMSVLPNPAGAKTDAAKAECAERMAEWAAALPQRCAVFAVNGHVERHAARAFAAAGRTLPRTATLCGSDGSDPLPEDRLLAERTSSVKIDFELSGYLAARMLGEMSGGSRIRATGIVATYGPLLVIRRDSTRGRGRRENFVLEALDTIRREACDGLSAEELAGRSGVSRSLFFLRFKEAMGHTVHDEIALIRLETAYSLLSGTDYPIGAVADMCGFGSHGEARIVFRARTGRSMSRWRALHRR